MKLARQTAFEILRNLDKENFFSDIALDEQLSKCSLDRRDKAFVSVLVYGVVERKITLDYQISLYLKSSIKKLRPEVLTVLRMGAYQILFMDKVPVSASINESVNLVKKNRCTFAAGLVNAVLRKISTAGLILPDESCENYLSVKYSCEAWLVDFWIEQYGKESATAVLESSIGATSMTIRVNTTLTNTKDLTKNLTEENVSVEDVTGLKNALEIKNTGNIENLKAFKDGLFHVQDKSSQLCCEALGVKAGDTVYDLCAAPGGKTFTLAQIIGKEGKIVAFDVYKTKLSLIKQGAMRLKLNNISAFENDASLFNEKLEKVDKILCDVPCSGLGVVRKKPEIKYKSRFDIDNLPHLQYRILCMAVNYLSCGGRIVYSTCTLNPSENEQVISRFLHEHPDFRLVKVLPDLERIGTNNEDITLMPHIHNCDGFYIAALERKTKH